MELPALEGYHRAFTLQAEAATSTKLQWHSLHTAQPNHAGCLAQVAQKMALQVQFGFP